MIDQDYIRKAIELADGWAAKNHHKHTDEEIIVYSEYGYWCFVETAQTVLLDALAAQLVRQVDAAGGYAVIVHAASTSIVGANDPPIFKHVTYANDRTMNTIKAIVDSGVLSG